LRVASCDPREDDLVPLSGVGRRTDGGPHIVQILHSTRDKVRCDNGSASELKGPPAFTANDCQHHFSPFTPLLCDGGQLIICWHILCHNSSLALRWHRAIDWHYNGQIKRDTERLAARQLAWRRAPAILTDALLVQEREICVIYQSRFLEPAVHAYGQ
jgi:hypothetical protein